MAFSPLAKSFCLMLVEWLKNSAILAPGEQIAGSLIFNIDIHIRFCGRHYSALTPA
jgi:hypothetical protein